MSKQSNITLLISTYNWPNALDLVLKSIFIQSMLPLEIVIADDGSSDETKKVIDKYKKISNIPLIHVWHEDLGFRKSLILNKAIDISSGEYIVQIDGDIILDKNFIKDHYKQRRKGFFVAASRACINPQKSEEILKNGHIQFSFFTSGLDTRFNALRVPIICNFIQNKSTSSWNVKGCNMAFWKKDFVDINGYYNDFKGWGWEDYELAQRFINNGVRKRRVKWSAIGYHIFHKLNSRGNSDINEKVYRETLTKKLTNRFPGLSEIHNN